MSTVRPLKVSASSSAHESFVLSTSCGASAFVISVCTKFLSVCGTGVALAAGALAPAVFGLVAVSVLLPSGAGVEVTVEPGAAVVLRAAVTEQLGVTSAKK